MKEKREVPTVPVSGRDRGKKLGRKLMGALVAVLLLIAVVLEVVVYLLLKRSKSEVKKGLAYEANVITGDISDKSKEERQRELNSVVEKRMLAMSVNATPSSLRTGHDRFINWLIEDPSNQGELVRVEVYRDDTGERIYETEAIKPGNYVESAPPGTDLPVGEYDCTARFHTYRLETGEYTDQATTRIKLVIYK